MLFQFHSWTIVFFIGIAITLPIAIHIWRVRKESWPRRFLAIVLFITVYWMFMDIITMNLLDLSLSIMLLKLYMGLLSYVFFIFFLIPYSFLRPIGEDKRILWILIIPTIMLLVMTFGESINGASFVEWGVKYDYDTPIYNAWAIIGFVVMMAAYVLAIFVIRDPTLEKPFKTKIKIFMVGTFIAFIMAYFGNVILEILFHWPPLSSLFMGVGYGFASLAFRKRRHE